MNPRHPTASTFASALAAAAASAFAPVAAAHSFVEPYLLPVPLWLYVYACAATLVLTFAMLGYFMGASFSGGAARAWTIPSAAVLDTTGRLSLALLRVSALACLWLTIVAGIAGTADPLANIAMPLFWMVFLLGYTYLTVLVGDLYALINPWSTMTAWIERLAPGFAAGRFDYPKWLGYYPALAGYIALIWLELFVLPKPSTLSIALLIYTLLTFAGVFAFGRSAWFKYGEMFAVFFRLVATMAPVDYVAAARDRWRVRLRAPLAGALAERPEHMGLVLFILFMLSSTTYDAIHDTELWVTLYWQHLVFVAQPLWGPDMVKAQHILMPWYLFYQRAGLVLSPFAYLALYLLMLAWAKLLAGTSTPLRNLALDFAPSLVPIAVVYNVTHYYTLLLTQLGKFVRVASDPFGSGWNLFGLGVKEPSTPLDMAFVWHSQVALILIGHVASVYLAHVIAVRVFPSRRKAVLSQIPLLLLMVSYTAIGLYILSLPLASPMISED